MSTKKLRLTREQAGRIGDIALAGKVVEILEIPPSKKAPSNRHNEIVDVYLNGRCIASHMHFGPNGRS